MIAASPGGVYGRRENDGRQRRLRSRAAHNSNRLDCGRQGITDTTGQERQKCQDFIHGSKSGYRVVGVRPAPGRRKKGGGQGIRETGNQKPSGQEG
jgi:hypothetical protein